mgnify:FL=1
MPQIELLDIEKRLETMHVALQRQEVELASWRHKSARLPNWVRNAGVALFLAIGAQAMTSVWWASEITNTQMNIEQDVSTNTEYRLSSGQTYTEIMIELAKMQVMIGLLTEQNKTLLNTIHINNGNVNN